MRKLFVDGIQADLKDSNFTIDYTLMDNDDIGGVIAARSTSIDCPVTPTNKKIFDFLDDATIKKSLLLKDARLEDGAFNLNGKLRVYEGNNVNYRTQIIGASGDWVTNIATKKLNELDFTNEDHILNKTNVDASETFDTSTDFLTRRNYVYPIVSYGKTLEDEKLNIVERYPAYNLRSLVYKIFQEVGYTVQGTLGDILEKLHIPYTGTAKLTEATYDDLQLELFDVGMGNVQDTESIPVGLENDINIGFNPVPLDTEVFDNGNNFNNVTYKYIAPENRAMNFKGNINVQTAIATGLQNLNAILYVGLKRIRATIVSDVLINTTTIIAGNTGTAYNYALETGYIDVHVGDEYYYYAWLSGSIDNVGSGVLDIDLQVKATTTLENDNLDWYGEGATVETSVIIPDVLQSTFLKSIFLLYNVVPITDSKRRIVYLNAFDDTFTGVKLDWSNKIIKDTRTTLQPSPKNYIIGYKDDESDAVYPTTDAFKPYEFIDLNAIEYETITNPLFASTKMDRDYFLTGNYGYSIPKMWSEPTQFDSGSIAFAPEWDVKHDLRVLYYNGVQTGAWTFKAGGVDYARTTYPEMTFYNDTINLMFRDYNGVDGIFKTHWIKRIKQMNENNTMSVDVVLSNNDIQGIIDAELNRDGRSPIDLGKLGSFNLLDITGINTTTGEATLNLIIETKNENSFIPEYAIFADFDGTQFSDFDGVLFSDTEIIN